MAARWGELRIQARCILAGRVIRPRPKPMFSPTSQRPPRRGQVAAPAQAVGQLQRARAHVGEEAGETIARECAWPRALSLALPLTRPRPRAHALAFSRHSSAPRARALSGRRAAEAPGGNRQGAAARGRRRQLLGAPQRQPPQARKVGRDLPERHGSRAAERRSAAGCAPRGATGTVSRWSSDGCPPVQPDDVTRAATWRVPGVANTCGATSVARRAAGAPGRQLLSPNPSSPRPKPTTRPVTGAWGSVAWIRSSTGRPAAAPSSLTESIRGTAPAAPAQVATTARERRHPCPCARARPHSFHAVP